MDSMQIDTVVVLQKDFMWNEENLKGKTGEAG